MLDIKKIKTDPKHYEALLQSKTPTVKIAPVIESYDQFCAVKQDLEKLQSTLNQASKEIGEKKRKGEDTTAVMAKLAGLKGEIQNLQQQLSECESSYLDLLARLPNLPSPSAPVSLDPKDSECIKTHLEKPTFAFSPLNHVELNQHLNLFDFERASKLSGSGWVVYRDFGARLEWALIQFMIDHHIKNGFTMMMPPLLVKEDAMFGAGQLPKFRDQLYHLEDKDYDMMLLPTAEVALNGYHLGEMMKEQDLPKRYLSYTPCFRREAGGLGAQERGLIRMHQFNKVEMFVFASQDQSEQLFHEMQESAETLLEKLGLHYRSMMLSTGDMSFGANKTVDIEVFLPGQDRYYEVSSVSHCTDFQARRSKTRYKDKEGKTHLVHTLNGSGLATSRLMVGLLETFQTEDKTVVVPEVLKPYMQGISEIKPHHSAVHH